MYIQLVFTIISQDKPGIVNQISDLVEKYEGNWLDSRMAQLCGEFAGIVHVSLPSEKQAAFSSALLGLSDQDITINIHQSKADDHEEDLQLHEIELIGPDRPGIVNQISSLFYKKRINILELDTQIAEASMSGGILFMANAVIGVNKEINLDELRDQLHDLANDLTLEIEWTSHL